MKKFLTCLFISIFCAFFIAGCSSPLSGTEDNSNIQSNEKEESKIELPSKHIISLNSENYLFYFDISYNTTAGDYVKTFCTIKGCLSYAYYNNVVFTIQYNGTVNPSQLKIVCNAAGNGNGSFSGRDNYSIVSVSGTVTYWI